MNIIQLILDTIVPPDPLIREIEEMGAESFRMRAGVLGKDEMSLGVTSFFPYKSEIVKAALLEIKSRHNMKIVRLLGEAIYKGLVDLSDECVILLPIPMTRKKERERGWNQCELLVKAIKMRDKENRFKVRTDILIKARKNDDQVGKGRGERFENLRGCFMVKNGADVVGKVVMVLDDIVTTGATLSEARRALTEAGAKEVILASVAH